MLALLLLLLIDDARCSAFGCVLQRTFRWHGHAIWPFSALACDAAVSREGTGLEIQFIDIEGPNPDPVGLASTDLCTICEHQIVAGRLGHTGRKRSTVYRADIYACDPAGRRYLVHTDVILGAADSDAALDVLEREFPSNSSVYCLPEIMRGTRPSK